MILILFLNFSFACSPIEKFKIQCQTICEQRKQKKWWVDSDGCNCGDTVKTTTDKDENNTSFDQY